MKQRLLRAAILLYPASWRQRYGAEMEQFVHDAAAEADANSWTAYRLVLELAVGALAERARLLRRRGGLVLPLIGVSGLIVAVAGAQAGSHNRTLLRPTAHRSVGGWQIMPTTRIGPGVEVVSGQSVVGDSGHRDVIVRLRPYAETIESVSGAPARVVIDPSSNQIISITRAGTPASTAGR